MGLTHTVKQGEYLAKIAHRYGFRNWRTIYDDPQNAGFRKKRPNPNVIFPGDKLYIPDKAPKHEAVPTTQRHVFRLESEEVMLSIILKDHEDRPLAKEPYILKIGGKEIPGETTGDGLLKQKIPHGLETAELFLKRQKMGWTLQIGHLDPVMDHDTSKPVIFGAQQRLNNLGFHCGKADGIMGPKTRRAVKMFQEKILKHSDPSGDLDTDTLNALHADHRS